MHASYPARVSHASHRLAALTSVRFLFAGMVFLDHFVALYWPAGRIPFAYSGVAVSWFFVLSGFVIAHNYPALPTARHRLEFVALRVARLWPVHVVVLAGCLAAFPEQWAHLYNWALPLNLTLTHSWIPIPKFGSAFNAPSWSVSDEMFFYLAFILVVGASARIRWAAVAAAVLAAAVLSFAFGCWTPTSINNDAQGTIACASIVYTFPPSRFAEFLAGVALRHAYPRLLAAASRMNEKTVAIGQCAAIGVALLSVEALVLQIPAHSAPGFLLVQILMIATGSLIVGALAVPGAISKLLSARAAVFGGELSYSLYMVHIPLMLWLRSHIGLAELPPTLSLILLAATILAAAAALLVLVERPARLAAKRWLRDTSGSRSFLGPLDLHAVGRARVGRKAGGVQR